MRGCFPVLALIMATLPGGPARAAIVPDLYAAEVPLQVRDSQAVDEAFQAALDQVLERVTGRRDVAAQPEAAALRSRARSMVQQWSYTRQGLWAMFDPGLLGRELQDAGLPQWGAERPLLLAWLVLDEDLRPAFVLGAEPDEAEPLQAGRVPAGDDLDAQGVDRDALRDGLDQVAMRRGLPLVLPRMDSAERALVTPELLCGSDFSSMAQTQPLASPAPQDRAPGPDDAAQQALTAELGEITGDVAWQLAATRYRADGMLIGCARLLGERVIVDWTLQLAEDERRRWRGDLDDGLHGAADVLARALAPLAGASGRLSLRIHGIGSLADYARVMSHLENLSLIDAVDIERASGDILQLNVRTRADAQQLHRALLIGRTLEPLAAANARTGAYTLVR